MKTVLIWGRIICCEGCREDVTVGEGRIVCIPFQKMLTCTIACVVEGEILDSCQTPLRLANLTQL